MNKKYFPTTTQLIILIILSIIMLTTWNIGGMESIINAFKGIIILAGIIIVAAIISYSINKYDDWRSN